MLSKRNAFIITIILSKHNDTNILRAYDIVNPRRGCVSWGKNTKVSTNSSEHSYRALYTVVIIQKLRLI